MREIDIAPPKYSVVVPFHDEQESVLELHRQLSEVMTGRYEPVEFIYVDDQSKDATPQHLAEIAALHLRRTLEHGYDATQAELLIDGIQLRALGKELGYL